MQFRTSGPEKSWFVFVISVLLFSALLSGCSSRAQVVPTPVPENLGFDIPVLIGTTRARDSDGLWSPTKRDNLNFARIDVSVPPVRRPGQIKLPGKTTDPSTDFLTRQVVYFDGKPSFRSAIRQRLREPGQAGREVIVTVHGFNNTMGDGVYRTAQMMRDLSITGVVVHYSWPSIGDPLGYAADRDSVLIARDGLEQLFVELRKAGAQRIVVVAHSMGSQLTMETLRQMAIRGNDDVLSHINGVVLMSPDLDVALFRSQAEAIGKLPQPFIIFVSKRDPVLALSARLTGQPNRLGNTQQIEDVAGLEVTVIDLSDASDAESAHSAALSSPSVLKVLEQATTSVRRALQTDPTGRTGIFPGSVLVAQEATAVILAPVSVIGRSIN
jgi:esterase/lipase superfamily enzyme